MAAPVNEARDEYADAMNLELRQSIAARVLEAMDVDQYLIDAVRNAKPPVEQEKPAIEEPTEWGSIVRAPWSDKNLLWVKAAHDGWWSESGIATAWSQLRNPEVLRVGIGERAP